MNIETDVIRIPGLIRTYTFYHTSDFHFPPELPEEGCGGQPGADEKRIVPPDAALENVLAQAAHEKADGLFLCGDLFDAHDPGRITAVVQKVKASGVKVMAVCGNHERISGGRTVDVRLFDEDYAPLMNGSPICWVQDFGEFLAAGVDNGDMHIGHAQLSFLQELAARSKPILLLMHAPMKTEQILEPVKARWGRDAESYFLVGRDDDDPVTKQFYDFVRTPESHVEAVFAGHIHLSHASEFAPGRRQYTSAAAYADVVRRVLLIPAEDASAGVNG